MSEPIELTAEGLMKFFERGYAGFSTKEGDYSDVLIDGTYDLSALARAILSAKADAYEDAAKIAEEKHLPQGFGWGGATPENIAKAIRSRSLTP